MDRLSKHNQTIAACRKCKRLISWCEEVAQKKKAAYRDQEYWGKPVPGFGEASAELMIAGLAPGAHGANRTGRMFTGDRSGDWLYRALYKAGFATQAESTHRDDGLKLINTYITAIVHCAPPLNKPTTEERNNCIGYFRRDLEIMKDTKVIMCLGKFAWDGVIRILKQLGHKLDAPTAFAHGSEARMGPYHLIGSYHPSQQNTFTGRLTEPMIDAVFSRAKDLVS